jgi:acyl-CoA reductase-like NAD-dependent aldehyde dehydrogenase
MRDETFGPAIRITSVKDANKTIDLANKSNYGSESCVFTLNLNLAREVAKTTARRSLSTSAEVTTTSSDQ